MVLFVLVLMLVLPGMATEECADVLMNGADRKFSVYEWLCKFMK